MKSTFSVSEREIMLQLKAMGYTCGEIAKMYDSEYEAINKVIWKTRKKGIGNIGYRKYVKGA